MTTDGGELQRESNTPVLTWKTNNRFLILGTNEARVEGFEMYTLPFRKSFGRLKILKSKSDCAQSAMLFVHFSNKLRVFFKITM